MSTSVNNEKIGIYPAADANVERYTFVKLVDAEVDTAGAGERVFGVSDLDDPVTGQAVQVVVSGVAKVISAAVLAADAIVASDANGQMVAVSSSDFIAGQLVRAVEIGEIGEVLLTKDTLVNSLSLCTAF